MKITWSADDRPEDDYRKHSSSLYANVTTDGVQIGQLSSCKDYLTDRYMYSFGEKTNESYPYIYNLDMPRLSFDKARVILRLSDGEYDIALDLVNQVDAFLGFDPSTYEVVERPGDWVFTYWEGDARYMIAPPLYGLWTLLMRSATNHTIGKPFKESLLASGYGTSHWFKRIIPALEFIVTEGPESVFGTDMTKNWTPLNGHSTNHDNVGPMAYARGYAKTYFPHWLFPKEGDDDW